MEGTMWQPMCKIASVAALGCERSSRTSLSFWFSACLCWPSTFLAPITTFKELGSKFRAMVLLLLHYGATTSARSFVICFYSWKDCRQIHLWKHLINNSKLIPFCVCREGGEKTHTRGGCPLNPVSASELLSDSRKFMTLCRTDLVGNNSCSSSPLL